MLKTRKRWVSLLVAVVMVAGLLIPFVGTANASCTYGITSVNNISAGTGVPQVCGTGEETFDIPTWESAIGSTTDYVYKSLPSSPLGYAFYIGSSTSAPFIPAIGPYGNTEGLPQYVYSNDVIGPTPGTADIRITGTDWVTVNGGGSYLYPQTLNETIVSPGTLPGYLPTSVTIECPTTIWVPSGVTGGVTITNAAPSGSIYSSGSGTIAMVGNATVTLAVESTPSISSAGGSVGIIDVTENAAGALMAGGNPGLKLTLPPGFTWETPSTGSMIEYMWGTDENGVPGDSNIEAPDITNNAGRELDINETGASEAAQFFKINAVVDVDEATAQTGNITVEVGGRDLGQREHPRGGCLRELRPDLLRLRNRPDHRRRRRRLDCRRVSGQGRYPRQLHLRPGRSP